MEEKILKHDIIEASNELLEEIIVKEEKNYFLEQHKKIDFWDWLAKRLRRFGINESLYFE